MIQMNNEGGLGITTVVLLISFILIAVTVASVLTDSPRGTSEKDMEETLDNVLDEITSYLQIKDMVGKYSTINEAQQIQKIALLIKPLLSVDIDVSTLTIKLCNNQQIRMLSYSGQAAFIQSQSLFEHSIWEETTCDRFSFIVTLDKDRSLVDHDTMNDHTDMAYIVIKLPEECALKKGDSITITLFSTGITRTVTLQAPLPIKSVVTFD